MTDFRVLILGNHGVELAPIVPDAEALRAHLGQECAPLQCWCGERHAVGEQADLTIHLGPNPPPHASTNGVTVAFVTKELARDYPVIVPDDASSFGPAAAAFVDNLVGCLMLDGLIGVDFADVRELLLRERQLRFHRGTAVGPAPKAKAALLHIAGALTMTLFTVNDIAEAYADSCDDGIIFASTTDKAHQGAPTTSMIYVPELR